MRVITQLTNQENKERIKTKLESVWVLVFALMFVVVSSAYSQQSAGVLLQSGLYKEDVNGDLEAAIEIYERVLKEFPKDRPIAAKALLHIGLCYEKLGKQEAKKAYQRLLKEYAAQSEPVRVAREHLEQLDGGVSATAGNGATYRLVLDEKIAGMPVVRRDFSPSGDRIVFVSQEKLYIADQTATVIRPLLDDLGPWEDIEVPAWSPDGRWIAYRLSRGLPPDSGAKLVMAVFVVSPAGGTPRQIGPEIRRRIRGPFWTPDSRHLSYRTRDGLRTLDLDGNEVRLIPEEDLLGVLQWDCGYSPNGRWVVSTQRRENGPGNDLCIFPATGGTVQRLINLSGGNHHPTWAPDGRTLYFVSSSNIWKLPMDQETGLATDKPQQLSFFKDVFIGGPTVLGDGDQIAFTMWAQNTSIQVADTSSPYEAHTLVRSGRYSPELSPDGQTVYYVNNTRGEEGIYALLRHGGAPRRLTQSLPAEGSHSHLPRFDLSPDGQMLAYCMKIGNKQDLLTLPVSGGEPRLLVKITEAKFDVVPQWSPDGSNLAYAAGKGLYVIPKDGGESHKLAHFERGWEECTVRWSPDGKFLAAFSRDMDDTPTPGPQNAVFVVPASGGELRQLTPDVDYKEGLEWHPDGKRLTYHVSRYESETRQAYLDGRPPTLLVNAPDIWDYVGIWAPDGRRFFFIDVDGIYVYDEASGKTTLVSDPVESVGVPCWSRDGKTMAWWATKSTARQTYIMENFLPKSTDSK